MIRTACVVQLGRRLLIFAWTESGSWLITARVCRVSWCSTPSVVGPDLVWVLFCWSVSLLITVKSLSWASPFIPHPRFQPPWLNPTTASFQPIPSSSTPMSPSSSTTKPSTTSAGAPSTLNAPLIPTSTASSLRYPQISKLILEMCCWHLNLSLIHILILSSDFSFNFAGDFVPHCLFEVRWCTEC